jgi:tRNA(Ile2)-agmatinylcytidine synthase
MTRYTIIGYPRLVRLNPNIPWKTRGNGALCLQVGMPSDKREMKIGEIDSQDIICAPTFTEELPQQEQRRLAILVKEIVDAQARVDDENTNPGYVLLQTKPANDFYKKAVTSIVSLNDAVNILKKHGALFEGYKNNRGLIGATAAIAWEPMDRTYELIAYRQQKRWGSKRQVDSLSVQQMDIACPTTFDNYDQINFHNRIVPNSPCPILYGIRGDDVKDLMNASTLVKSEPIESWLVYETNQGTDDHLQRKSITQIQSFESVITEGTVSDTPTTIQGGHVFFNITDQTGTITCAAYEPTKEFRHIVRELSIGDIIEVSGGVRDTPLTINLEKLFIKNLASIQVKSENPICPHCGKHMKSKGTRQKYKCIKCGTTSDSPRIQEKPRSIKKGFYEVPICARRHLTKPLKRIKHQPSSPMISVNENEYILR